MSWLEKMILLFAVLRESREQRRLPEPDLRGAKGRRYTDPKQGHAPHDAPRIVEGEI